MSRLSAAILATTALLFAGGAGCPDNSPDPGTASGTCEPLVLPDPPPEAVGLRLVDNTQWVLQGPEADPWEAQRPADKIPCGEADVLIEELSAEDTWYSVSTANCGYITVSQPLLHDIPACTDVLVHLWQFKFSPPKSTEVGLGYEVIVTIGDPLEDGGEPLLRLAGDRLPGLPEDPTDPNDEPKSTLFYEVVRTQRAYTKGEPVYYHVSNHGQNSWEFLQLRFIQP